jgi:hypothetical protein
LPGMGTSIYLSNIKKRARWGLNSGPGTC